MFMAGSNERRNKAIMDRLIKELKEFPLYFDEISENSLNDAVSVAEVNAKDLTPSITGDAKAKWQTTSSHKIGNQFIAKLYNNSKYIGYINNGHRMEPHFVPGEWVGNVYNYDPSSKEGVMMGAKTKYVKGKFMLEKASGIAEKHLLKRLEAELNKLKY